MASRFVHKAPSRLAARLATTLGLALLVLGILITPVWALAILWVAEEALGWLLG